MEVKIILSLTVNSQSEYILNISQKVIQNLPELHIYEPQPAKLFQNNKISQKGVNQVNSHGQHYCHYHSSQIAQRKKHIKERNPGLTKYINLVLRSSAHIFSKHIKPYFLFKNIHRDNITHFLWI
jgi:hypothetical protein